MKTCLKKFIRWSWRGTLLALLSATVAFGQTDPVALTVRGAVDQPLALSLTNLQGMARSKMSVKQDLRSWAFEGVALYDVVTNAHPRLTAKCCSNTYNVVIVAKAADNYQAAFLLSELDPKSSRQPVLIADRRDGEPLNPTSGPLQIVAPEDKTHARWVRQVRLIEVIQIGDLGQSPTNAAPH